MGRAPRLDEVVAILKAHEDFFRAKGVTRLAVFGSVARGDATADSDVDLLVELSPEAKVGLLGLIGMEVEAANWLGRKVDMVTPASLHSVVAASASEDMADVFR